jgi:hypothetical protein
MTRNQFWLGALIVGAVVLIAGPIGVYSIYTTSVNREAEIQKAKIQAEAEIKQAEIEADARKEIEINEQEKATERTKERWEWTQRIPFFKDEAGTAE